MPAAMPETLGAWLSRRITAYYAQDKSPFGALGDFTTAPEISQLFGETLAVWLADVWQHMGMPPQLILCECGAGRGTLLADMLRVLKRVPGLGDALQVYILENSAVLRGIQHAALSPLITPQFIDTIHDLPADSPTIFIGNEFLDALPVEQLRFDGGMWQQHTIMHDAESVWLEASPPLKNLIPANAPQDGTIIELSPARLDFMRGVLHRIARGGAALFADYGYREGFGDTVQAVFAHKAVSLFHPGADLSSHVDFGALQNLDAAAHVETQRAFLLRNGIQERLYKLAKAAPDKTEALSEQYRRLTDVDGMGTLFKILTIIKEPPNAPTL